MTGAVSYFGTYLGLGIAALLACRFLTWLRYCCGSNQETLKLLNALNQKKTHSAFIKALKLTGEYVLILLVWPIAVIIFVWDTLSAVKRGRFVQKEPDPEELFFAKHNLIEQVTIPIVEGRERVVDPSGRAPAEPFGHLNSGWKAFLKRKPSEDAELWSFNRVSDDKKNWSFDRANGTGRGYCWVTNGKVISEIRVEGS